MDQNSVLHQLLLYEEELKQAPKLPILSSHSWREAVPKQGGVYVIWENFSKKPVYIGETCHLNHRFIDLGMWPRHTFRRKASEKHGLKGKTEKELSEELSKLYSVSYLPILLGRKEVEEFLNLKWRDDFGGLMNDLPGRLQLGENLYKFYKEQKS
jgi:hypothetical protein